MNTRWLKQNLVVVIFVVIFVALLGAVVWLEQKAISQQRGAEAALRDQEQELKRLQDNKPYPSTENVQMLRRDREEMQAIYHALQQAVTQDRLSVPDVQSDIDFVDRLTKTLNELRDLAKSQRVAIADDFAFGFSRYKDAFPCRNPPARGEECQRILTSLAKQLVVVEKLSKIAISNRVESITLIRRVELEPSSTSSAGDVLYGTPDENANARYRTLPFDIQMITGEKQLQSFINNVSESDCLFIIKKLTVEHKIPSNLLRAIELARNPMTGGALAATVAPSQKRVLATLRIDLVEFPSPPSQANEKKNQPD